MTKVDVDAFVDMLEAQALRNDNKVSGDEQYIIDSVSSLDRNSAYSIYLAVLKAAYKDKIINCDEEDLMRMARDILKIDVAEHQKALLELDL